MIGKMIGMRGRKNRGREGSAKRADEVGRGEKLARDAREDWKKEGWKWWMEGGRINEKTMVR
jgi:hypothetical protein